MEDLINLLLWNHPVSESFIATWFAMTIERARKVMKMQPGKYTFSDR
jgi:cytochrome c-type biogenesis protein CcmH/NrfF